MQIYSFLILCEQGHHWEKEKEPPKAVRPESLHTASVGVGRGHRPLWRGESVIFRKAHGPLEG